MMFDLDQIKRKVLKVGVYIIEIVFVSSFLLVSLSHAASIVGSVVFRGEIPSAQEVRIKKDTEFCGETRTIQSLHVHPKTKGVKGVVVNLVGAPREVEQIPSIEVVLANKDCTFVARVNAAMVKQVLQIRNDDPLLHNTNIGTEEKTFINVALVEGGTPIKKRFKRPGLLRVECHVHKFMQAYIHVFDHPYFAVTNEIGQFRISGILPGTHRIEVWHEYLGTLEVEVVVPSDEEVSVNLQFPGE